MSIFLNKDSKVIVQGITGGEGTKHTALMLKAGTQVVGRGVRGSGRQGVAITISGCLCQSFAFVRGLAGRRSMRFGFEPSITIFKEYCPCLPKITTRTFALSQLC